MDSRFGLTTIMGQRSGPLFGAPLEKNITSGRCLVGASHVRDGNATYTDPDTGLITIAGTNIPRFESVGGYRAILREPGGENYLLQCRDLTQGDWTKSTATAAKDQIGEDGVANSASSLLATAGDATCLQQPTIGDTDYCYAVSIKRITGAGNIEVTDDGGGTWTDIKSSLSTTAWYRKDITRSQANPDCGIRIVTNGDKIAVDYNQLEAAKTPSSRILTTNGTASRTTESGSLLWTLPTGLFNAQGTAIIWVRFGYPSSVDSGSHGILTTRDSGAASLLYVRATSNEIWSSDGTNIGKKGLVFAANTWYKLAVKWGYGAPRMQVGVDTGSGISWGTEDNFAGSYVLGANLQAAWGLFGPLWLRDMRLYGRIVGDGEIDGGGSP